MLRYRVLLPVCLFLILLAGCGKPPSPCPVSTGAPRYISVSPEELPAPTPGPGVATIVTMLGGKSLAVDKIVTGPLCNDTWSGTVYVGCNVEVYPWEKSPDFLKNCNLTIQPGTVVYVADHNDTAYYKGCSCHSGEYAEP